MAGARLDLRRLGKNRAERQAARERILRELVEDMGGVGQGEPLLAVSRKSNAV